MWHVGMLSNRWLLGGLTVQAVLQIAITYLPVMNSMFRTAPIGAETWLAVFAIALGASMVVGLDKRLRQRPM